MARVKRAVTHVKKRKKLLKRTKGFMWSRKNTIRAASVAVTKAGVHAYVDRKKKKRNFRALWQIRIGAALANYGLSYSKFIGGLKVAKIEIDRKVLADLAANNPEIFSNIVEKVKAVKIEKPKTVEQIKK